MISDEYRALQAKLHADNPNYGVASQHFAPLVAKIIEQYNVKELLDYGAGKGRLGLSLTDLMPICPSIKHYDPAIEKWSKNPDSCEMVACIDVLEHIEPEQLDNVFEHLQSLVERVGFFTIHTGPAMKILADGRNAHLIQETPRWWLDKITSYFDLQFFKKTESGFWVIVHEI